MRWSLNLQYKMNLQAIKKDFPYHQNKDDDFYILELAKSYRHCTIRKFDFSNSTVSYDAIVALWRSDLIGYYLGAGEKLYERSYNKLMSIVFIEIRNSKAYEQYLTHERKRIGSNTTKKIFPLPYRDKFLIDAGSDGIVSGFKEIILTVEGKPIDNIF